MKLSFRSVYNNKLKTTIPMTTKNEIQIPEQELLTMLNDAYWTALKNYEKEISAEITAIEFTGHDMQTTRALNALKIYTFAMQRMLEEHDIEELDWNGRFIPEFDWITLSNWSIDDYADQFDLDLGDYSITDLQQDLHILLDAKIIKELTFYTQGDDHLISNFKIDGFTSDAMEQYDLLYSRIRDAYKIISSFNGQLVS